MLTFSLLNLHSGSSSFHSTSERFLSETFSSISPTAPTSTLLLLTGSSSGVTATVPCPESPQLIQSKDLGKPLSSTHLPEMAAQVCCWWSFMREKWQFFFPIFFVLLSWFAGCQSLSFSCLASCRFFVGDHFPWVMISSVVGLSCSSLSFLLKLHISSVLIISSLISMSVSRLTLTVLW